MASTRRILFGGYAPVHFLCFLPVLRALASDPEAEVWLTGGFRDKHPGGALTYRLDGFYDPALIGAARVIPVEEAREQSFDALVCSHLSDGFFPREYGRSVQIFHGVSFKNFAVREKALRYDLLCLPGRYHAEKFLAQRLVREGGSRCLVTGFPKVDALVRDDAATEVERRALLTEAGVDPERPTILYAPTGGKNNSLETMGRAVIEAIGRDGRWNLLVKPHDHPKRKIDWFDKLADLEGATVRLVRGLDVVPWLRAADVLLTDASSVSVEYSLLDRPIVFLDVPKLLDRVIARGAPLDLQTYGRKTGRLAKSAGAAVDAIAASLADPAHGGEARRAMAAHVFHSPGEAASRVAEVVRYAAGLRADLPAGLTELQPGSDP